MTKPSAWKIIKFFKPYAMCVFRHRQKKSIDTTCIVHQLFWSLKLFSTQVHKNLTKRLKTKSLFLRTDQFLTTNPLVYSEVKNPIKNLLKIQFFVNSFYSNFSTDNFYDHRKKNYRDLKNIQNELVKQVHSPYQQKRIQTNVKLIPFTIHLCHLHFNPHLYKEHNINQLSLVYKIFINHRRHPKKKKNYFPDRYSNTFVVSYTHHHHLWG